MADYKISILLDMSVEDDIGVCLSTNKEFHPAGTSLTAVPCRTRLTMIRSMNTGKRKHSNLRFSETPSNSIDARCE